MSTTHAPAEVGGAHGGNQSHGDTHGHGSRRSYLIGFVLAVVLSALPFWLVMGHVLNDAALTTLVIFALAAIQIVVHIVFFLHVDTRAEGGWTLISLVFAALIIGIMVGGSVWIMFHSTLR